MGLLTRQGFKTLFELVANGDKLATSDLILYCMVSGNLSSGAVLELATVVREVEQRLSPSDPNLLFLQALLISSKPNHSDIHPEVLNRLEKAHALGHSGATTYLAYIYHWESEKLKKGEVFTQSQGHDQLKIALVDNSIVSLEDSIVTEKEANLVQEAFHQQDAAALCIWACFELEHLLKLYDSMLKNPAIKNKEELKKDFHKRFQDYYKLLDQAVALGSMIATEKRAYFYQHYCVLTQQKEFLPNYTLEDAHKDLEIACAANIHFAFMLKAQFFYRQLYGVPTNPIMFVSLVRKAHLSKWELTENIKQIRNLDEFSKISKSTNKQNPSVEYHILMALNQNRGLWRWHYKIKALYRNRSINDPLLTTLLMTISEDDLAPASQKFKILAELVKNYAIKLKKAASKAELKHYQIFKSALDVLFKIADTDKELKFVIKMYNFIPKTYALSAEVQMQLADFYYSSALQQGYSYAEALELAKPYHAKALERYKTLSTISPEVNSSYKLTQLVIKEREFNANPSSTANKIALNASKESYFVNKRFENEICAKSMISSSVNMSISAELLVEQVKPDIKPKPIEEPKSSFFLWHALEQTLNWFVKALESFASQFSKGSQTKENFGHPPSFFKPSAGQKIIKEQNASDEQTQFDKEKNISESSVSTPSLPIR